METREFYGDVWISMILYGFIWMAMGWYGFIVVSFLGFS